MSKLQPDELLRYARKIASDYDRADAMIRDLAAEGLVIIRAPNGPTKDVQS